MGEEVCYGCARVLQSESLVVLSVIDSNRDMEKIKKIMNKII